MDRSPNRHGEKGSCSAGWLQGLGEFPRLSSDLPERMRAGHTHCRSSQTEVSRCCTPRPCCVLCPAGSFPAPCCVLCPGRIFPTARGHTKARGHSGHSRSFAQTRFRGVAHRVPAVCCVPTGSCCVLCPGRICPGWIECADVCYVPDGATVCYVLSGQLAMWRLGLVGLYKQSCL